jgi:hypothetical protein
MASADPAAWQRRDGAAVQASASGGGGIAGTAKAAAGADGSDTTAGVDGAPVSACDNGRRRIRVVDYSCWWLPGAESLGRSAGLTGTP